jgi:hypothetical protein
VGGALARVLGSLGWEHPGWPAEQDLLWFEARLTDTVRNLQTVVVCATTSVGAPLDASCSAASNATRGRSVAPRFGKTSTMSPPREDVNLDSSFRRRYSCRRIR